MTRRSIDHSDRARDDEWQSRAREALLAREKEHTRLGDELARERRALPWVRVEQDYRFDTEDGERTLAELFDGRSQLLVYHFMFGPSYEAGDAVNSSIADTIDGVLPHLRARDVTFVLVVPGPDREARSATSAGWAGAAVGLDLPHRLQPRPRLLALPRSRSRQSSRRSPPIGSPIAGSRRSSSSNARAPGTDIAGYLTESPGFSTFVLEDGAVYQAYPTTWRGLEFLMGYYPILDHAPKGRDEGPDDWQLWLRRHDEYASNGQPCSDTRDQPAAGWRAGPRS